MFFLIFFDLNLLLFEPSIKKTNFDSIPPKTGYQNLL